MGRDQIFYGKNVLIEALNTRTPISKVFVGGAGDRKFVEEELRRSGVRVEIISDIPRAIRDESHQGVAFQTNHNFYEEHLPLDLPKRILLCNHLEDIQNLGAISRAAAAFDFPLVVHEERRSFKLNAVAVKISMGTKEDTRVFEVS